jgi:hypothetical protein
VFLLVAAALLAAGCGVSDYAGHMSSEAALLRMWKEEEDVLGEPLRMPEFPKKDGKDQQTWNVFLRPPHGVSEKPTAQQNSKLTQFFGPLAQYAAKGNRFGIQNIYLGVGTDPKEFPSAVYGQFGASPEGESAVTIPRSPVLLSGAGKDLKPEIVVKRKVYDGPSFYSFNFYDRGKVQVAVVFQMDKGSAAKARDAIEKSLSTLGEGAGEAPALRSAYLSRNRKTK